MKKIQAIPFFIFTLLSFEACLRGSESPANELPITTPSGSSTSSNGVASSSNTVNPAFIDSSANSLYNSDTVRADTMHK